METAQSCSWWGEEGAGGEVFFENWCVLLLHSSGIESGKVGIKEERNFLEKVRIEEQQHTHRA